MSKNLISILVEPHKGRTDDEVVKELSKLGANDIEVLARGFISAQLPQSKFKTLELIAHIHIKQTHQFL